MMDRLVTPIMEGKSDFVIGSRTRGHREAGSMNFHQVFAGYMVGFILRILYGVRSTDMGPFRAIRRDTLDRLGLREENLWLAIGDADACGSGRVCAQLKCLWIIDDRAGGSFKNRRNSARPVLAATRILITLARIAIQR